LLASTALGLVATLAAPWVELRGTYAAWRIVEWHTFWRGSLDGAQPAFQLADVVASNGQVPVEFATSEMPAQLRNLLMLGSALGVWHGLTFIALLAFGTRMRLCAGVERRRVALEIAAIVLVNLVALYLLTTLLALPSSLTPKVDFRTAADIHTDSLIWSSVTVLPIAPVLSVIAVIAQVAAMWSLVVKKRVLRLHLDD